MKHYYMFNKPFGCVTAHRDDRFPVVMDYFHSLGNDRLSPVGRLDRETEGLLMITDDGVWNQKMTNPAFHVPKTYEFAALGTLNEENLQRLSEGVLLIGSDRPTTGASVTVTGTSILSKVVPHLHPDMQEKLKYNLPDHPVVFGTITISEGKFHQVKKMFLSVGVKVTALKRVQFGDFTLDSDLAEGQYRPLNQEELKIIKNYLEKSG